MSQDQRGEDNKTYLLTLRYRRSQTDLTIRCMFPRYDDWELSVKGFKKTHPGEAGILKYVAYVAAAVVPFAAYILSR